MEAQGWNRLGDGIAGGPLGADILGCEECCGVVWCADIPEGAMGTEAQDGALRTLCGGTEWVPGSLPWGSKGWGQHMGG